MARFARTLAVITAVLAWMAGGSQAADRTRVVDISSSTRIVVRHATIAISKADPERCVSVAFAVFPDVPNAVAYAVSVRGLAPSHDVAGGGPPFPYDSYRVPLGGGQAVTFEVGGGSHWFPVSSASSGTGCGDFDPYVTSHFSIASAHATVRASSPPRPEPKPKPVPKECRVPPGEAVALTGPLASERRFLVVRKNSGSVTVVREGTTQRVPVHLNTFVAPGTVVSTGPNGVMKIGALHGAAVLIGPETTVRMTERGFVILAQRRDAPLKLYDGPTYKVRTNGCVIGARG